MGLTGTDRQPKHMEICDATGRIINQVNSLEELADRVRPAPPKEVAEKGPGRGEIPLSEFLESEPGRLNALASKLESLIEELRVALF